LRRKKEKGKREKGRGRGGKEKHTIVLATFILIN
jgi:hypothetical protein